MPGRVETRRDDPDRFRHRRAVLLIGVAVLSAGVGLALWRADALRTWELQTVDARFSLRGDRPAPLGITVVAVDDRTIDTLQERPPLRRSRYATRSIASLRRGRG